MRVILIGDPASGKSTFLRELKNGCYHIHPEKLSARLHLELYKNLVLKNVNYGLYFFERDFAIWHNKKTVFLEYTHHATYSFIKAHERAGKMSHFDRITVDRILNQLNKLMPLAKNDIVLHFICNYQIMARRLKTRAPHMSKKETDYINYLRAELKNNFLKKCHYYKIDTSNLKPGEVKKKIKNILPWIQYKQ